MKTTIRIGAIVKLLGRLVFIEAAIMILPLIVALIYGESQWKGFLVAIVAAAIAGGLAEISTHRRDTAIRAREGFIVTALVWVVFAVFGMMPFLFSNSPLCVTDGMFEVISGLTTTGASVIPDVEVQPKCILFWRALTQWIGGLGIVLFMLAVLPELNKAVGISMFNAEATGITHTKIHPRIRQTALSLWGVYSGLTVISVLLLWIGPMDLFDSVCQTFATVATGGFTTHNDGIQYWHSDYVTVVITIVMFIAGANFMLIYGAWKGDWKAALHNDVFKTYTAVVIGAYLLILASSLISGASGTDRLLIEPIFHVLSAITSTGFSLTGPESWGAFTLFVTILLMLCGSCAGSTTGGIKIDRGIVLGHNFVNEIKRIVFPKRMYVVRLSGSPLNGILVARILAFVTLYMMIIAVSTGIITLWGYSFTDSLFMSVSCTGCNGLGYGVTGVDGSFAVLPHAVKWLLMLVMLVGRLELFTFLVLLLPSFWRR